MSENNQDVFNQKEKEKQVVNNYKFKLNKIKMNKLSQKESIAPLENENNSRMNNMTDNINLNKNSFKQEVNNKDYNNNNKDINNKNFLDSEIYIVDDNDNIEKPPNAIEINDIIGKKCKLDLNILSKKFKNFAPSKTFSKKIGIIEENYTKKYWPNTSFFGIYDGHGGSKCSEYLKDYLHKFILSDINFPENVELAIKNGFLNAEKTFLNEIALNQKDKNIINDRSGSCAIIVLIIDSLIYVANVGDSRALFSEKNGKSFVMVTEDHKPNNKKDKERIIKNDGHVYRGKKVLSGEEYENLNGKILLGPFRVLPGRLSVSRTIGDIESKNPKFGGNPKIIICEPDIFVFDLIKNDIDFFIMGCDGIFDQISNEEIIDCAWTILNNNSGNNKENKENKDYNKNEDEYDFENVNIHDKCGLIVDYIIKSSMVRKSLDNVTCLMIALKDFNQNEKGEHKFNLLKEYMNNIYKQNNSVNNLINSQEQKSINHDIENNSNKKSENINKLNQQNNSEINNKINNSVIIDDAHNMSLNNKINKNNFKEMPKKFLKSNFKLNNLLSTKNNLQNIQNEFLTRIYRNTDVLRKNNYKINSKNYYNNFNNNRFYVKEIKDGNPRHKRINKTEIIINLPENFNNSNITNKNKVISKIKIKEAKRPISNSYRKNNMVNHFQEKDKETSNNKLEWSKNQNNLSNDMLSLNKKNKSSINNNLIQKLIKNKMPSRLNNKLINQNNLNNSSNVNFHYSNTYSNTSEKCLGINSIGNIPSITPYNNHLTTSNVSLNSINAQLAPKKLKNVEKPKLFRYNNTCLNNFKKTFYKNKFCANNEKINYNNNSHELNNINNIIYSRNFKAKIKYKKGIETMTSCKKKYSYNKIIKSFGINTENPFKNEINQLSNKKISYSKEKDIKSFLHKNKTNIVSEQNENNNNCDKNTLKKKLFKIK